MVLTKPGQAGLELSKEAIAELEGAEAAAAKFSHSASGEPLVNADPQATATAVVAQLAACMPELQDAGTTLLVAFVSLYPRHRRNCRRRRPLKDACRHALHRGTSLLPV